MRYVAGAMLVVAAYELASAVAGSIINRGGRDHWHLADLAFAIAFGALAAGWW